MSSSKRQSVLPKGPSLPKAPANLSSSVIIADSAILTGGHTVNVSSESVVHPRAKLDSTHGRVTIGRRCIVDERTHVGAHSADPAKSDFGVLIDDYVTVEVGAKIEAGGTTIAEGCVIGPGAIVGKGAKIGKHCTITAKSIVQPHEEIPENTVIYSNGLRRIDKRDVFDLQKKAMTRQIEILKRLMPSNREKFV